MSVDSAPLWARISAASIIIVVAGIFIFGSVQLWGLISSIDIKLAIGVFTAITTVLMPTMTVVVGKYLERKKEIESHFREKKIEIYDDFLKKIFEIFDDAKSDSDLLKFLKEWQRKIIVYGGANVLQSYTDWMHHLKKGNVDIKAIYLMGKVFLDIRNDIGLSNSGLSEHTFVRLILKQPDLFIEQSRKNPNMTLQKLQEIEASVSPTGD